MIGIDLTQVRAGQVCPESYWPWWSGTQGKGKPKRLPVVRLAMADNTVRGIICRDLAEADRVYHELLVACFAAQGNCASH